jgi:hypothetical protein
MRKHKQFLSEDLKEREKLEDLGTESKGKGVPVLSLSTKP